MPSPRVTLRDISREAGVSTMTVSNVMRGRSNVSPPVRAKVREIAKRLGYSPDPHVAKLMAHLRQSRVRNVQANIGFLMSADDNYARRLYQGANKRAADLGYQLEKIYTEPYQKHPRRLRKVLQNRGIEGILLGPLRTPGPGKFLDEWSCFSVISLTHSILSPRFDIVVPNEFHNAFSALQNLRDAGVKRPALLTNLENDERIYHAHTAAFAWDAFQRKEAKTRVFNCEENTRSKLAGWLAKARPDKIVLSNSALYHNYLEPTVGSEAAAKLPLACLARAEWFHVDSIDLNCDQIGSTGVELLVRLIMHRIRGIPTKSVVTMVDGTWVSPNISPVAA